MSDPCAPVELLERIHAFSVRGANDELTEEHWADFERLLRENDDACRLYGQYVDVSILLPAILSSIPAEATPGADVVFPEPQEPAPAPALPLLGTLWHGTIGFFSQEIPFALLVATVITSLGLVGGSMIYVTHNTQLASNTPRPTPSAGSDRKVAPSDIEFVGRVTGMADVRWADINTSTEHGNGVPLGRKYALASGLMEITYDSGAKVILQGPVTYEVDSRDSGFLSVGKLTARLEKRGEGRGESQEKQSAISGQQSASAASGQSLVASETNPKSEISKSSISNPQSLIPNPSLAPSSLVPRPSSLFAIRTPTAIITDLGTEFGVEVDKHGTTASHVFRGSVEVQVVSADGKAEGDAQVLRENQSARVEKDSGKQESGNRVTVFVTPTKLTGFAREIPKLTIKTLDLVDVVAGGDGFSGRRGAGIDPSSGRVSGESQYQPITGDGRYHRVEKLPLVDGVFIPAGKGIPVQVDSAGHTFATFSVTQNATVGYVWAGGAGMPTQFGATLDGVDYSSTGHGVLVMHANKGITFSLEAIRKANPSCRLVQFRSVAGNVEPFSQGEAVYADIWVLVDGRVRFRRQEITGRNGAFSIAVPLSENDRFLTLVATDGGNGGRGDWIIFGDPRLELLSAKPSLTKDVPDNNKSP